MQFNNTPFNFWSQIKFPINYQNPFMDPDIFVSTMADALKKISSDPEKMNKVQGSLKECADRLGDYILRRMQGAEVQPLVPVSSRDKRFSHEHWESNIFLDIMKQSYLVFSEWFEQTLNDDELDLDPAVKKQLKFYSQQMIHAMAPSNFAFMNPMVVEEAQRTYGASMMKGLLTMVEDFQKRKGPDMTDMGHFKLGENIATSKGAVIFRNDLIELIQYSPKTKDVYKTPMLIVPPWINKYYVFDLTPEKSMVNWLLDQGRTVFMISWVNPDKTHRNKSMESYVLEGPKAALDVVKGITGEKSIDALGYCLGGTLLSCLAASGYEGINSLTLLTTLTDFSDAGDLTTFMSESYVRRIETRMVDKGYLSGKVMAQTFNMLRPTELLWSYVVNNYYLGKDPVPFDFLFWNSDNTNMPEAMHRNLLRLFYQQNILTKAGEFRVGGKPVDLGKITHPVYMMSTKDDHIAPWETTFKGVALMSNAKLTFVLGGSGHVAGVINPPSKNKYGYWTNANLGSDSEQWFKSADQHDGSWWSHWHDWLSSLEQSKVTARVVGAGDHSVLCDAPGTYVLRQCE